MKLPEISILVEQLAAQIAPQVPAGLVFAVTVTNLHRDRGPTEDSVMSWGGDLTLCTTICDALKVELAKRGHGPTISATEGGLIIDRGSKLEAAAMKVGMPELLRQADLLPEPDRPLIDRLREVAEGLVPGGINGR